MKSKFLCLFRKRFPLRSQPTLRFHEDSKTWKHLGGTTFLGTRGPARGSVKLNFTGQWRKSGSARSSVTGSQFWGASSAPLTITQAMAAQCKECWETHATRAPTGRGEHRAFSPPCQKPEVVRTGLERLLLNFSPRSVVRDGDCSGQEGSRQGQS